MQSYIQWNKGYNFENVVRKIYSKYVYKGSGETGEIDILYSNITSLINNAQSESDLQEVESIVSSLMSEGKINSKEFNYLINAINDKRKEL